MTLQTGIIDFLRAEGLPVIEVNGWQTRGRPESDDPFNPHGSVNHHTAGAPPSAGTAPSLGICIDGRSDLAGPLCHVLQSRQKDGNTGLYVVYLIACGRANHAGAGGWRGLSQNHSVWGLEIEHTGDPSEPFSAAQRDTAVRVHTAFAKHSKFTADMTCQHYEWTSAKMDFVRDLLDPDQFRGSIGARLAGPAPIPAPAPEEEQMNVSCPTPWVPNWPDGREPFLKACPGPVDNSVNIISFNGAPLERVPVLQRALDGSLFWGDGGKWQQGRMDAKGRVVDSTVFGVWWMRTIYDTLGGPEMLARAQNDTQVILGTSAGGTYLVAHK